MRIHVRIHRPQVIARGPAVSDLSLLDKAPTMLARARTIQQVISCRNSAEALRLYARSTAAGQNIERRAAEMRLLSERKAGELLAAFHLHGGDRKSARRARRPTLKDFGITPSRSARWQQAALVPQAVLERYLRQAAEQGEEPSCSGLLRMAACCRTAINASEDRTSLFDRVACALRRMAARKKEFTCIYAAPPWPNGDSDKSVDGSRFNGVSIAAMLKRLPVRQVAGRNAQLYLLSTSEALSEAITVLHAWGFRYASCLFRARTSANSVDCWRQAGDILVLSVRGEPDSDGTAPVIRTDGGSQPAPDRLGGARGLLERIGPGPRLNLFGSVPAPGWTLALDG